MLIVSFIGFFSLEWIIRDHNHESTRSTEVNKTWTSWLLCHLSLRNSYGIYMIKGLKFTWLIDTISQLFNFPEFFFSIWATSTTSLRIILSPPLKTRIPKVIPKENRYIYIICSHTLFIFNHTKIKIVPLIILWWEQIDLH